MTISVPHAQGFGGLEAPVEVVLKPLVKNPHQAFRLRNCHSSQESGDAVALMRKPPLAMLKAHADLSLSEGRTGCPPPVSDPCGDRPCSRSGRNSEPREPVAPPASPSHATRSTSDDSSKSTSQSLPSSPRMQFSGLTSRWRIPSVLHALRISRRPDVQLMACSGSYEPAGSSRRVSPGTYVRPVRARAAPRRRLLSAPALRGVAILRLPFSCSFAQMSASRRVSILSAFAIGVSWAPYARRLADERSKCTGRV